MERNIPMSITKVGITLGLAIILLGILDIISTNMVLANGGVEVNPIVASTMEYVGEWWQVIKMILHILLGICIVLYSEVKWFRRTLYALIALYIVVVTQNFVMVSFLV